MTARKPIILSGAALALIVVLTGLSTPTLAGSFKDGQQCGTSKECRSTHCRPGPSLHPGKVKHKFCLARKYDCALKGSKGGKLGDTIKSKKLGTLICVDPKDYGWGDKTRKMFMSPKYFKTQPKLPDGKACKNDKQCQSGQCYPGPAKKNPDQVKAYYCKAKKKVCAIPGGHGLKLGQPYKAWAISGVAGPVYPYKCSHRRGKRSQVINTIKLPKLPAGYISCPTGPVPCTQEYAPASCQYRGVKANGGNSCDARAKLVKMLCAKGNKRIEKAKIRCIKLVKAKIPRAKPAPLRVTPVPRRAKTADGFPCNANSACASGICNPGPSLRPDQPGSRYCMAKGFNCARPGRKGARFGESMPLGKRKLLCNVPTNFGWPQRVAQFFEPVFRKKVIVRRPTPTLTPQVKPIPAARPRPKPPGRIVIRGIPYEDHSANTELKPSSVPLGGRFTIESSSLPFVNQGSRQFNLKVFIQDANRPANSAGVTGFGLTQFRGRGKTLTVTAPNLPLFRNRTFHVTVFIYLGSKNQYAYAGTVRFR